MTEKILDEIDNTKSLKIHDMIIKEHDRRIFVLETNQEKIIDKIEELNKNDNKIYVDVVGIKSSVDTLVTILQTGNTFTYIKYGAAMLGTSLLTGLIIAISAHWI